MDKNIFYLSWAVVGSPGRPFGMVAVRLSQAPRSQLPASIVRYGDQNRRCCSYAVHRPYFLPVRPSGSETQAVRREWEQGWECATYRPAASPPMAGQRPVAYTSLRSECGLIAGRASFQPNEVYAFFTIIHYF